MKNFNNNLKNFKIALTKEYNTLKKSLKTTLQEAEKLKITILNNEFSYSLYKKNILRNCNSVINKSKQIIDMINTEFKKIKILKDDAFSINQLWSYCYKNEIQKVQEINDLLNTKLKEAKKFKHLNEQYNKQNEDQFINDLLNNI